MQGLTMTARKIMYRWPQFLDRLPNSLVLASRTVIDSGRAARDAFNNLNIPTHL